MFRTVAGFEDVWRPPVRPSRPRKPETVLAAGHSPEPPRARLWRIVGRAPEVMVKVTGRTRDAGHLKAHLDYITRNGELEAEDRDGVILAGRRDVRDLAQDWAGAALADPRHRANTPFSHAIILSMPAGTDPIRLRDAARAFASRAFADRHDYVFALHTDTPRPHVHLSIRSLGERGERLGPKKADLEAWRQMFAEALRERGIAAEATPRRTRGITRKSERIALRKVRDRHEAHGAPMARRMAVAFREAARAAFQGDSAPRPWETQMAVRQARIRALYRAQAGLLMASSEVSDRDLGRSLQAFVEAMPSADSRRLALARELRAANARQVESPGRGPLRDRSR